MEELVRHNLRQMLLAKIIGSDFLLYAPENTFLRKFEEEGGIDGLGFRGEGLFDYLQTLEYLASLYNYETYQIKLEKLSLELKSLNEALSAYQRYKEKNINYGEWENAEYFFDRDISDIFIAQIELHNQKAAFEQIPKIKTHLRELLDWFEDFQITGSNMERKLYIKDRFLPEATLFDQKSANEGFLLLLFYLTLFTGAETPAFFAIDNIDTGLNPKLGSRLIEILAKLAKEHNKQAIITTHNPAILDGLDLRDDAQRLFVVSRNKEGRTKIHRIEPKYDENDDNPIPLSEQFLRGYIGGLPLNF